MCMFQQLAGANADVNNANTFSPVGSYGVSSLGLRSLGFKTLGFLAV